MRLWDVRLLEGGLHFATLWEARLHRQITGSRPKRWWEVDWSGGKEGGEEWELGNLDALGVVGGLVELGTTRAMDETLCTRV